MLVRVSRAEADVTLLLQIDLLTTELPPGNDTADDENLRPDALTTLTVVLVGECLWDTLYTESSNILMGHSVY
jgi:hypothetical protein